MLERHRKKDIIQQLSRFPAVVLCGPRQSGKTTLAKTLGATYFDLELEGERLRLDLNWPQLIKQESLLILDEAQSYPEIFPRLRAAIDDQRRVNGRFLILGSIAPSLMKEVSESLAGRTALIELMPLALKEVGIEKREQLWRYGGFPDGGIIDGKNRFPVWQDSYLRLIVERDLPNLGIPAKPMLTERLLRMIAAVHGQEWNASKIAGSLGINYQTVNSYLDYLHGTFLTRALTPFETNLKKRIVKHPKIYLRDSGLLHSLLGLGRDDDLFANPWIGASWEGFVIEQIMAALDFEEGHIVPHFLRSGESEIDLILRYRGELWAFEIKLTSQPSREDTRCLRTLGEAIAADRRILVHGGEVCHVTGEIDVLPLEKCLDLFREVS